MQTESSPSGGVPKSERVVLRLGPLDTPLLTPPKADVILLLGYRHIIPAVVWKHVPTYNIHISMLPWNRGACPNLWSWVDNTPKGVTLHRVDGGLDTGPIVKQYAVNLANTHTLKSSYALLMAAARSIEAAWYHKLQREEPPPGKPQTGGGTFHTKAESDALLKQLPDGFDTKVDILYGRSCSNVDRPTDRDSGQSLFGPSRRYD